MRRQIFGFALVVCGLVMMLSGVGSLIGPGVASAMPSLQPSPRPPVQRPTQVQDNDEKHKSKDRDKPDAVLTGRITGTIIDLNTGAPMPGITVSVGGVMVTSDVNGNYDQWLNVGMYGVGLVLQRSQGVTTQGLQTVEVTAGGVTVQHLSYRSVQPHVDDPTAEPALPQPPTVPGTTAAPVATVAPAAGVAPIMPRRLPKTSLPSDTTWLWLPLGAALVLVGMLMWGTTTSASAQAVGGYSAASPFSDGDALLATLLANHASQARRSQISNDALLTTLLDRTL